MGKKKASKKQNLYFEVRFVGRGVTPDSVSLRAVNDALSAVQDLACGRDPYEMTQVPHDKGMGLVNVRKGSATYRCVPRAPKEASKYLSRIGKLLATCDVEHGNGDGDELVAAMSPIKSLSDAARSVGCDIEVKMSTRRSPLFVVTEGDFKRISSILLLSGETTVAGSVERVGGATGTRCLMRVPGRRHILYCDVKGKDLARRLGQHLYEDIVAQGTAVWIHRSWRIYKFTINSFTQPRVGDPTAAIEELRNAGLDAWDEIDDPETYIKELRS